MLTLPRGSGHETYIAQSGDRRLFVKLDAQIGRTLAMSEAGLTPPLLATGVLQDGSTILIQPFIEGHHPGREDYRQRLDDVARIVREMHRNPEVLASLPPSPSDDYASAGMRALDRVRARWAHVRAHVPGVASFVDRALNRLEETAAAFSGGGLVASHSDICWDNWLFTPDGRIFVVDLDAMSLDDPTLDLGALLWWYYRPELWSRFLHAAGYAADEEFTNRMWTRLALHCLNITLPRAGSFDRPDTASYDKSLVDFRAVMERKANPEI
jgi:thiamine kinase-like enzyme